MAQAARPLTFEVSALLPVSLGRLSGPGTAPRDGSESARPISHFTTRGPTVYRVSLPKKDALVEALRVEG